MKVFPINAGDPPLSGKRSISAGDVSPSKCLVFSFRYWRQIENFGFSGADLEVKWFVSLLEQLQCLSGETVDEIRRGRNSHKTDTLRYHEINWNQKNIPISRADLNWLPREVVENEDEFTFYQFHISKGSGRVMGYWDSSDVFHVVLLDPMHNLQPSRDYNYKVDPCYPLRGQYQDAACTIDFFRASVAQDCAANEQCATMLRLRSALSGTRDSVLVSLPQDQWDAASALIKTGKIACVDDLWAFALLMAETHPECM